MPESAQGPNSGQITSMQNHAKGGGSSPATDAAGIDLLGQLSDAMTRVIDLAKGGFDSIKSLVDGSCWGGLSEDQSVAASVSLENAHANLMPNSTVMSDNNIGGGKDAGGAGDDASTSGNTEGGGEEFRTNHAVLDQAASHAQDLQGMQHIPQHGANLANDNYDLPRARRSQSIEIG